MSYVNVPETQTVQVGYLQCDGYGCTAKVPAHAGKDLEWYTVWSKSGSDMARRTWDMCPGCFACEFDRPEPQ